MAVTLQNKSDTCLQEFADWLGVNPLLFNCADIICVEDCIFNSGFEHGCDKFWDQYAYEGIYNREDLARCLCIAEQKLYKFLGTFPHSKFVCGEEHEFPQHYNKGNKCFDARRWSDIVFKTEYSHVIEAGVPEYEIINNPIVEYLDEDRDTFCEVGEVKFTLPEDMEVCNLKFYFVDEQLQPCLDLEICPVNCLTMDSDTREVTVKIDSWLLIKPELYTKRSFVQKRAINICDKDNLVNKIAVMHIGIDKCKPDAMILHYDDAGCTKPSCDLSETPACIRWIDKECGYFYLQPVNLDEEGCVTSDTCLKDCICPISICINYKAGLNCSGCFGSCSEPCCSIKEALFNIAASCLPLSHCDCPQLATKVKMMQYSTGLNFKSDGVTFNYPSYLWNNNPLGLSTGEVQAFILLDPIKNNFKCPDQFSVM